MIKKRKELPHPLERLGFRVRCTGNNPGPGLEKICNCFVLPALENRVKPLPGGVRYDEEKTLLIPKIFTLLAYHRAPII